MEMTCVVDLNVFIYVLIVGFYNEDDIVCNSNKICIFK